MGNSWRWLCFFQWDNPPLANAFSEIDSFGFHIRLPGSVKAIYYILCFRGWTLIIFWTGPWTSGISQNNPKNGLKIVFFTKRYLLFIVIWKRGCAHEHAIYLVISTVYLAEEALDLRSTNTTYRQAINHKYKIMRLGGLCKWFLREFAVGKMWIGCWGYCKNSIFVWGSQTDHLLFENPPNLE